MGPDILGVQLDAVLKVGDELCVVISVAVRGEEMQNKCHRS